MDCHKCGTEMEIGLIGWKCKKCNILVILPWPNPRLGQTNIVMPYIAFKLFNNMKRKNKLRRK